MDPDNAPLLHDADTGISSPFGVPNTSSSASATAPKDDAKYFEFSFRGRYPIRMRLSVFNVLLTIMTILTSLMMSVTLPLFSQSMVTAEETDEYTVLFFSSMWFPPFFFALLAVNKLLDPDMPLKSTVSHRLMIFVGLLNSLNGVLVVYASDPARTSPQLQAILGTSVIPFTVICRYIILRKGVSIARLVCTGIVLIGLFISLEPVIFNVDQPHQGSGSVGGFASVVWPFIFTLGFLPIGIMNSILERELKRDQTESLVFQSWVQLYSSIIIVLLFWTDFIPKFGASENPKEFWENLKHGANCMYGQDPSCHDAVLYSALFIIAYCLANLFIFLLVRFAEGAVYLVVVQALVTPLGAIFWTIFSPDPYFHFHPVFNTATAFVLGGLAIMVPAVVMYNYFGAKEAKAAKNAKETNGTSGPLKINSETNDLI